MGICVCARVPYTTKVLEKQFMKIHLTSLRILAVHCYRRCAPFNIHLSNFLVAVGFVIQIFHARAVIFVTVVTQNTT